MTRPRKSIHTLWTVMALAAVIFAAAVADAKLASEIPRFNTPVTDGKCGNTGNPPSSLLGECTEPLAEPFLGGLAGYWRDPDTKEIKERIEVCGSRVIVITPVVVHDFLACTGQPSDGLGVQDYSAFPIINAGGMCQPIAPWCAFEPPSSETTETTTTATTGTARNTCVHMYTDNPLMARDGNPALVASRCLLDDGQTMEFFNLGLTPMGLMGSAITYEKVPAGQEPNCVGCSSAPAGPNATTPDDALACAYGERVWKTCPEAATTAPAVGDGVDDEVVITQAPKPAVTEESGSNPLLWLSTVVATAVVDLAVSLALALA